MRGSSIMQMYKRYNSEKGMCVIKKYRNKYKMTIHRCLRIKGMEECDLSDKIEINNRIYPKIDFKKADYTNISVYVDDLTGAAKKSSIFSSIGKIPPFTFYTSLYDKNTDVSIFYL